MLLHTLSLVSLAAARFLHHDAQKDVSKAAVTTTQMNTTGFQNPTILYSRGGNAICVSGNVPVTASAQNIKLNYGVPQDQSQVTQTIISSLLTAGPPNTEQAMNVTQAVSSTYNISAAMCLPTNGTSSTIQVLTHGLGFDRNYWDWAPGYSYADFAATQGYATFLYDRLGVGASSKPDPIAVVQAPLQVEIAVQLIRMLRNGQLGGMTPAKVVGTGHSFGSIITQSISARYPTLLDGVVLTGWSLNNTGQSAFMSGANWAIASQNQPNRFANLSNGYIVSGSAVSIQTQFFHAPGFNSTQLALADATKGTVTFGEIFTSRAVFQPSLNYTGPVAVVLGDADLPFCAGNCSYPVNQAVQAKMVFPRAKNSTNSSYLVPNAGHGINLHYAANQSYAFISNFLKSNGL